MIYILIAGGIFILDLLIKDKVEKEFSDREERLILGGKIRLKKLHNYGAALHFMEKKPELVRYISGIITACAGVCFTAALFRKGSHLLKAGLSILLGGALSNLYDRCKRGYVTDYFSFQTKIKRISKIVFNLSDMFIFAGAILIAIWDFFRE